MVESKTRQCNSVKPDIVALFRGTRYWVAGKFYLREKIGERERWIISWDSFFSSIPFSPYPFSSVFFSIHDTISQFWSLSLLAWIWFLSCKQPETVQQKKKKKIWEAKKKKTWDLKEMRDYWRLWFEEQQRSSFSFIPSLRNFNLSFRLAWEISLTCRYNLLLLFKFNFY